MPARSSLGGQHHNLPNSEYQWGEPRAKRFKRDENHCLIPVSGQASSAAEPPQPATIKPLPKKDTTRQQSAGTEQVENTSGEDGEDSQEEKIRLLKEALEKERAKRRSQKQELEALKDDQARKPQAQTPKGGTYEGDASSFG
eukprot:5261460-Amphidinium_carterae.3